MANKITSFFPTIRFFIKTENFEKDSEMLSEFVLENITLIQKVNIPFNLTIRTGSLEVTLQLLKDLSENPTVAQSIAAIIGAVTYYIIKHNAVIKKSFQNESWQIGLQLKQIINEKIPHHTLKSIQKIKSGIKIEFMEKITGALSQYEVKTNKISKSQTNKTVMPNYDVKHELEHRYEVDVKSENKPIKIPEIIKAELKISGLMDDKGKLKLKGVNPRMLARMKKEFVSCPVFKKDISFIQCFVCPNYQSRVLGKVLCKGDQLS